MARFGTAGSLGGSFDLERLYRHMNPAPDRSLPRASESGREAGPTQWARFWTVAILASTFAEAAVLLLDAPEVIRAPITVWFIASCPGMAIVRLLRLDRPITEIMLGIALSLALACLVPGIFIYLSAWSPAWSLTTLMAVTGTAWVLDLAIFSRRSRALFSGHARPARPVVIPLAQGPRPTLGDAQPRIRGQVLGRDGLTESESTVSLRSALDLVIGDIAARRQRDE
jgi:hypothetical protein